MTLRITASGQDLEATVRLDGRLTREEAPELRRVCAVTRGRLVLDLTGLQSADRDGVRVLRELRRQGVQLIGASPYIELLLDRPACDPGT